MKTAVVTGASSGIGFETAKRLLEDGYFVYGLGRTFQSFSNENFEKVIIDLRDVSEIEKFSKSIKTKGVDVLVNAAGCAYYGIHENLTCEQISDMVDVNVKAPFVLTSLLLSKLRERKGIIVNVSSVTAKQNNNTHGVCYGATKAALTSFGTSLFEEVRKHGIRIVNIHPDLTDTQLYRNADFCVSGESESTLFPEEIADIIMHCLSAREGMCINDVTVKPQCFKVKSKR